MPISEQVQSEQNENQAIGKAHQNEYRHWLSTPPIWKICKFDY